MLRLTTDDPPSLGVKLLRMAEENVATSIYLDAQGQLHVSINLSEGCYDITPQKGEELDPNIIEQAIDHALVILVEAHDFNLRDVLHGN